jgi:hypothetical protein
MDALIRIAWIRARRTTRREGHWPGRWRDIARVAGECGQTTTEYLMVAAVLTATSALILRLWGPTIRFFTVAIMHYVKSIAL